MIVQTRGYRVDNTHVGIGVACRAQEQQAKTNFQESQRLLLLPLYIQPFVLRMLCSCNLRNMAAFRSAE
jgi:hypothetical protein